MDKPYTSAMCRHTFSSAIIELLRQQPDMHVTCPIPGCDQQMRIADLKHDVHVQRRLNRFLENQAA
jgi:hypothetical protein